MDNHKLRLIQKGETDLYIFSLLKEMEDNISTLKIKMDILEKRMSILEDFLYPESFENKDAFDQICEHISYAVKKEIDRKAKYQSDFIVIISNRKHHFFNDFSNNYGYSKYTEAYESFCKKMNEIIESDSDDCPYHQ